MKKNKYLHFAPDSVYTQDYIHKINKLYHEKEHCFFVYSYDFGKKERTKIIIFLLYKIIL